MSPVPSNGSCRDCRAGSICGGTTRVGRGERSVLVQTFSFRVEQVWSEDGKRTYQNQKRQNGIDYYCWLSATRSTPQVSLNSMQGLNNLWASRQRGQAQMLLSPRRFRRLGLNHDEEAHKTCKPERKIQQDYLGCGGHRLRRCSVLRDLEPLWFR